MERANGELRRKLEQESEARKAAENKLRDQETNSEKNEAAYMTSKYNKLKDKFKVRV